MTHRLLVPINSSYHTGMTTPPFLGMVSKVALLMFRCAMTSSGRSEEHTSELQSPCDRKSTRLNSSHHVISYAVFCLKKKNNQQINSEIATNSLKQLWSHP